MKKHSKKAQKATVNFEELVIVTFVEDLEHAKDYEALLKNNDIPAIIREDSKTEQDDANRIVVMVPEDFIDEAHVVIESQDAYDDFYDLTFDDDDMDNFENDFLEDDF